MADRLRLVLLALLAGALAVVMVAGAAAADDVPTETPSESPSETATASPSETATASPSETATASPSETATETPSESPTQSASPTPVDTGVAVDDALLRWGVNNESNNKAFAPRTFNFFSAGLLPDPGRGGVTITQPQWQASSGNARVEKWDGSAWLPATWSGLGTDSSGAPLSSPTEGRFSNHTFVLSGGTGSVDAAAGVAHIAWDADLTVLYYSGMSFFHVSDPVLDVEAGRGTLTAVLHGYRSSQSDQGVWEEVPARRVVIADLPTVDLADVAGFVSTPAYAGVLVSGVPQVTAGPAAGSFPQSFVDYLGELGAAAFWYSSGASTDPFKVALPLSVSYDASAPVVAPAPSDEPSAGEPSAVAEPTAVPPPTGRPVPVAETVPVPVPAPLPLDAPREVAPAPADVALLARPATDVRLTSAAEGGPGPAATSAHLWWVGGGLLLVAALLLLLPAPTPARDATRVTPERKP